MKSSEWREKHSSLPPSMVSTSMSLPYLYHTLPYPPARPCGLCSGGAHRGRQCGALGGSRDRSLTSVKKWKLTEETPVMTKAQQWWALSWLFLLCLLHLFLTEALADSIIQRPLHHLHLSLGYAPPPSLSLIILIYSQSRNPLQQAPKTLLPNRSTTIPPADLGRVNYFFFFNDSANAPFAGANLGSVTLSYQNNGISRRV